MIWCFACEILWNCRIAGGFESLKERGLYFWRKPKVAKTFLDSTELQNHLVNYGLKGGNKAKTFLRFCVAESRVDLRFVCEILGGCIFCVRDSAISP